MIQFEYENREGYLIIRLSGDLMGDADSTPVISKVTEEIAAGTRICLIDIAGLRYINSNGIGILITILTKFRNRGGEVYLMNPSESVQKLLVITKLNAIFQMVNSEEEVIKR